LLFYVFGLSKCYGFNPR